MKVTAKRAVSLILGAGDACMSACARTAVPCGTRVSSTKIHLIDDS